MNEYRSRDFIEKCFKMSKSECDLFKFYAQSDSCAEAKAFLVFISAIYRSEILSKLKYYFFVNQNETSQCVIENLDNISVDYINKKFVLWNALTKKQKEILVNFDIKLEDFLDSCEEMKLLFNAE